MWAVSHNLNILILLCFTKASAYFSLLCKGCNTPTTLFILSHWAWLMACIFQTRQIGWYNGTGLTMSHKKWEVWHAWAVCVELTFSNSHSPLHIAPYQMPRGHCIQELQAMAKYNGMIKSMLIQHTFIIADPVRRVYNINCKLSHCKHLTVLYVLVSVNWLKQVSKYFRLSIFSQMLWVSWCSKKFVNFQAVTWHTKMLMSHLLSNFTVWWYISLCISFKRLQNIQRTCLNNKHVWFEVMRQKQREVKMASSYQPLNPGFRWEILSGCQVCD